MRGVGAGSSYRQTKNRYIIITSVSPDTLVDHKSPGLWVSTHQIRQARKAARS